jgi:uncharacterized protein with NRDE domain
MCLIVFAWQVIPGMPLLAAGNRDEFFERPTAPARWWDDHPDIYAGRDLREGGTWMGVTRDGRFASITNIRAPSEKRGDAPSRGKLVLDYLSGDLSPQDYIREIENGAHRYNGFNLLIGQHDTLIWYSNKGQQDERNGKPLAPGVYGLSNALLDAPWPKVVRTKAQFASLLCQGAPRDAYFEMLTDSTRASDCRLPHTGVSQEWERVLSAAFIESPEYGTRSSTVVQLYGDKQAALHEQVFK